MNYKAIGEAVDRLVTVPMSNWTILKGLPLTDVYHAAREKAGGEPLTMLAAQKIREAVEPGETVLILSGFLIANWVKPETDGPVGAAALARSIDVGLGGVPVMLCEELCKNVMEKTCQAAGLIVCDSMEEARAGGRNRKTIVMDFPLEHEEAKKEAIRILDELKPKAVISVERGGWNEKKEYHSGMGYNVSANTAKLDYLFLEAQNRGIFTLGIGDLGNELGMGFIKEEIKRSIPNAEKCLCPCDGGIACDVSADIGIMCNISNWGAYGVSACLAALCGEVEVLHSPEVERFMIRECVRAGAIDSASGMHRSYVDGEPEEINAMIIRLLHRILEHRVSGSIFTSSYQDTWGKKN